MTLVGLLLLFAFALFLFLLEPLLLVFLLGLAVFGGGKGLEILHADGLDLILLDIVNQLCLLFGLHLDHDILRFQIGVDNVTVLMQVDEPHQHIDGDLLDQPQRHALILELVVLDKVEQVGAQNLEHRAVMLAVDAVVGEVINQQQWPAQFSIHISRMQFL